MTRALQTSHQHYFDKVEVLGEFKFIAMKTVSCKNRNISQKWLCIVRTASDMHPLPAGQEQGDYFGLIIMKENFLWSSLPMT